jgi:hypothetical protein
VASLLHALAPEHRERLRTWLTKQRWVNAVSHRIAQFGFLDPGYAPLISAHRIDDIPPALTELAAIYDFHATMATAIDVRAPMRLATRTSNFTDDTLVIAVDPLRWSAAEQSGIFERGLVTRIPTEQVAARTHASLDGEPAVFILLRETRFVNDHE